MRKPASFTVRLVLFGSSFALLLATWVEPRLAHAQAAATDRVQNEVFDDDLLTADLGAPFGAKVFGSHLPPARTRLIRPRTNFLAELYKSVEHL